MKKSNVLVTGVGAVIGYGIIKSIKKIPGDSINVVGIDIFSDAVGRHWCDHFVQGIYAQSDEFGSFIHNIISEYDIDLIIPGIEQDVDALSKMIKEGSLSPDMVALNSELALDIFQDKLNTSKIQEELDIPHIPYIDSKSATTSSDVVNVCGLPCIYKPYSSYAGKGLAILHEQSEIDSKLALQGGIFQKYIRSSKEYTVSIFGLDDGSFINPIAFERHLGPDGATHKAKVIDFSLFESNVRILSERTKPKGPTNFQFIANNGEFLLLEVNPRISSSTSMRQKFGVNEAQMCIQYYLNKQKPCHQEVRYGKAERYLDEVVIYDSNNI